jgi:PAS domain S-box-containing protein
VGPDARLGALRWSEEQYRIFGYEPGSVEIDFAFVIAAVHPDDRAPLQNVASSGVGPGSRYESEYRIVRPDGAVRVIRAWSNVERDAAGQAIRLRGTCQDITERKLAESEIRQTREHLQVVVDAAPAMIARYDRAVRLVWANKNYAARFGKKPEELAGKQLREIVGEEAVAPVAREMARVLGGETVEMDVEIPYPGLGRRSMHFMAAPAFDAQGALDGCVAVITDDTHRRELERERERALEELRAADRHKDEFLAMLSHELRNPMAPILTAVEILRVADPNDAQTSATFRAVIERQIVHMKRLLDDLLDISRVSQGKIELRREVVDLWPVVQRAVEMSRPLMTEKGQRLSLTTAGESIFVDADPARLVQVFGNLLNNASKYSEPSGSIEVEIAAEGGEVVFRLRDHGVGMSRELLERAFDLFVQDTRSLDRAQGGLGIGLTMVRSLVKMHGGTVQAFSDGPGLGCEMVVRLPRVGEPARPAQRDQPRAAVAAPPRPLRILVVDDNHDAASALARLLTILGHVVAVAHDGRGALAKAADARPELVFIDIGLPGMDGYALGSALRAAGLDRRRACRSHGLWARRGRAALGRVRLRPPPRQAGRPLHTPAHHRPVQRRVIPSGGELRSRLIFTSPKVATYSFFADDPSGPIATTLRPSVPDGVDACLSSRRSVTGVRYCVVDAWGRCRRHLSALVRRPAAGHRRVRRRLLPDDLHPGLGEDPARAGVSGAGREVRSLLW